MAGRVGARRDESPAISSANVFAALGSLKKKKKKPSSSAPAPEKAAEAAEKEMIWAPAPLTKKSWADVDDDDDDDYYAVTAPPQAPVWAGAAAEDSAAEAEAAEAENEHGLEVRVGTFPVFCLEFVCFVIVLII